MTTITLDSVSKFLKETEFKFKPGQDKVSYPKIERIHRRLCKGLTFSAIKIVDGQIIDGHHRFICLSLLGMEIDTVPGGKNITENLEFSWEGMIVETTDYDSESEIKEYARRFDA